MKITIEELKEMIMEALSEISHDTAADGIESMQHDLEEEEKPKTRVNNKKRKPKKHKSP